MAGSTAVAPCEGTETSAEAGSDTTVSWPSAADELRSLPVPWGTVLATGILGIAFGAAVTLMILTGLSSLIVSFAEVALALVLRRTSAKRELARANGTGAAGAGRPVATRNKLSPS